MKKALLIKLEAPSYSSMGMEEAFREVFDEVRSIDWQRVRFNGGTKGLERLWEEIARECKMFQPDLIFCQIQKSDVLTVEDFKTLSEYAFVINYTEDVRDEEQTRWYEEVAPHIGMTIFTNMDDCRRFWEKGLNAFYMMVSYNHLWYRPQPKTIREYGDIVFIGNNFLNTNLGFPGAQERLDMCQFMKDRFGDRFQAYGMGMENQALSPAQVVEAYNNCKIVITQNHFKREGYMSDRGLNAMGCGALTVHQHFTGIRDMFNDFYPLLVWRSLNELYDVCNRVEELDWGAGYHKRIYEYILKNHSWKNRVKFVKGIIEMQSNPDKYVHP